MPIHNAQEQADLEQAVTDGRMLADVKNRPGWKKILEPEFEAMRKKAYDNLAKADNLQELYRARAAIELIDIIISNSYTSKKSLLESRIDAGREAAKRLAKEKQQRKNK